MLEGVTLLMDCPVPQIIDLLNQLGVLRVTQVVKKERGEDTEFFNLVRQLPRNSHLKKLVDMLQSKETVDWKMTMKGIEWGIRYSKILAHRT